MTGGWCWSRQYRYLDEKYSVWNFPGGGINKDESVLDAANREFAEKPVIKQAI